MAHFGKDLDDFKGSRCIHIRSAEQMEHFTLYHITVTIGQYSWTVKHRYSEFHYLHEKLVASHKLDRSLLPPKKIFGNQTESFIKKRQRELEIYLQTIVMYLVQHIPSCLAYFLDFDKYEIHGITQALAEDLYSRGESLLQSREKYEVSTLQLYSLTERLKLPEPTCDSGDVRKDLGHILDFITRTKHLKIVCSEKPVGTSNILMHKLPFELTLFKSLQTLEICGCNFRSVNGLETVKQTLTKLEVHESASSMKEMLLQDAAHWKTEDGSVIIGFWNQVTELDFSCNSFSEIHDSIQLVPNVEKLNLSHNMIESIQNLHWLSELTDLDLSHNNIHHVDSLHTKLGNLKYISLAYNQLESLRGFAKLFSLQTLDVSHNKIQVIEEVSFVSHLPCVEDLFLEGNPMTSTLDYRTKTLEMFRDRVVEVALDGKPADRKELDTIAVLQALMKAKDVKTNKRTHPRKNASAVSLSDMYGQSLSESSSDYLDGKSSYTVSPSIGILKSSLPSNIKQQDSSDSNQRSSLDSVCTYKSVEEVQPSLTSSSQLPAAGATETATIIRSAIDQTVANSNNNSRNKMSDSYDIPGTFQQVVPDVHTLDLGLDTETPASCVVSLHSSSSLSCDKTGKTRFLYNAADLPLTSDLGFDLWLNEQLVMSGSTACDSTNNSEGKESVVDILWCYGEQLSNLSVMFSCCAILTNTKIFIEKLTGLESNQTGVPELKPCAIIPIQNIQQIILGPCYAFLRLEEAFLGNTGVFTLFATEPQGVKRFVKKLRDISHDLELFTGQSFVDLTVQSDLLHTIAEREEQAYGLCSDRLVSSMLVQLNGNETFSLLVLSEYRVYTLDLSCVRWPPATFQTAPEKCIHYKIQHEFSIMDKISNIKINHTQDKVFHDGKIKCETSSSQSHVRFLHHDLSFDIAVPEQKSGDLSCSSTDHPRGYSSSRHSCHFPSAAYRDLFLDRLSNMRAELAHRVIQSVREEPEGGNEQLPSDKPISQSCSLSSSKFHLHSASGGSMAHTHKVVTVNPVISSDYLAAEMPARAQNSNTLRSDIPHTVTKLNGKVIASTESVTSDKSFGHISLSESEIFNESRTQNQTPTSSTIYFSTSPRDDISVSPMSNFSRASISPVLEDESKHKRQVHTSQVTKFSQQNEAAKTESLPSSFDWKRFYLNSSSSIAQDLTSAPVYCTSRSQPQGQSVSSGTNSYIHKAYINNQLCSRFLEDIKPSTESQSCLHEETEHELYLKQSVKSFNLIHPLSSKLKPLCLMSGYELRSFFHSAIAQNCLPDSQDVLCEELHYVLWSTVVPYINPRHEITTLVMLSTYGIYLVSDTSPYVTHKSRPSWMTHSRNQSDSALSRKSVTSNTSHSKVVEPYFVLRYKDLQQVNIGLFDQCIRLTGRNENSVFTVVTRDSVTTETFIQKLKHVLSLMTPSPSREKSLVELEQDFYEGSLQRTRSTLDGIVYTHPSQVRFVYPGEDAIRDILYLINEHVCQGRHASSSTEKSSKFWFYVQSYLLPSDEDRTQPRSVVITATYFCLMEEDVVTYPLPDFVRGLPENPCHEILECRRIDSLKRVNLFHANPHCVSLTFFDEPQDIVVDVSMQHFSSAQASRERQHLSPEITYRLFIQSIKERDRMVQVLEKLWQSLVTQTGRILDINKL